jgi:outer membrane murein-binding lipoprotein Lpp
MTEILSLLAAKATPYIIGGGAILAAFVATYVKGRLSGAKLERQKQAAGNLAAAEDRLEMDREATAAERNAAGMTDDEARAEAMKWAKR